MVAIAVAVIAVAKGGHGDEKKPDVPLEFLAQEVVQPTMAPVTSRLEFSGPLVAPATAIVRAKAAGTLLTLSVQEGDRVRAGQALGSIDLAEVTSLVAERNANLASAQAGLDQAQRVHSSNERLAAQQFISANALETSRAALDTARAQFNAAQASLQMARVGLRDGQLLAPIAGIVAKRHVLPGEKVSPEQQVLTIIDLKRLELAGHVGTHEVARLAAGMPVQLQVEGLAQPYEGRIARIAPAAEPGTRSIGVTIEVENAQERLRAGQYAIARVDLADDKPRLTVPATALVQASGQNHVWMIESGVLARRAITLGLRDERNGRVEVLSGVTPMSAILTARFDNLREGAKASVVAGKAAAVASAAASTPVQ
ncbi:MAG: efflux RND transporter periplasmic adaptor subunit [Rubrivivax sp.]|nr:efflux RND transporter periplasmic adaptor subunit [Rubrivivax sp.]